MIHKINNPSQQQTYSKHDKRHCLSYFFIHKMTSSTSSQEIQRIKPSHKTPLTIEEKTQSKHCTHIRPPQIKTPMPRLPSVRRKRRNRLNQRRLPIRNGLPTIVGVNSRRKQWRQSLQGRSSRCIMMEAKAVNDVTSRFGEGKFPFESEWLFLLVYKGGFGKQLRRRFRLRCAINGELTNGSRSTSKTLKEFHSFGGAARGYAGSLLKERGGLAGRKGVFVVVIIVAIVYGGFHFENDVDISNTGSGHGLQLTQKSEKTVMRMGRIVVLV